MSRLLARSEGNARPEPRCLLPRRLPGYRPGQPGEQRCASTAQAPGRLRDIGHSGDCRFGLMVARFYFY
jgi:hypothetical protein